jgi:hypothetical protein
VPECRAYSKELMCSAVVLQAFSLKTKTFAIPRAALRLPWAGILQAFGLKTKIPVVSSEKSRVFGLIRIGYVILNVAAVCSPNESGRDESFDAARPDQCP